MPKDVLVNKQLRYDRFCSTNVSRCSPRHIVEVEDTWLDGANDGASGYADSGEAVNYRIQVKLELSDEGQKKFAPQFQLSGNGYGVIPKARFRRYQSSQIL